jgi:hypothetical protein
LHLWHFDETGTLPLTLNDAVSGGLNLTAIDTVGNRTAAGDTGAQVANDGNPVLGSSALPGYGSSIDFSAAATTPAAPNTGAEATSPHRPIVLGKTSLTAVGGGGTTDPDAVPFTFANATTGAFTMEAIIKFSSLFDPSSSTFRTVAASPG